MLEISVIGHIGRDAEVKNKNGKDFVAFSVAHSDKQLVDKETGEVLRGEKTYWISVATSQMSLAPYLKAGTQVFIRGRLSTNIYKEEDGKSAVGIKCSADTIQLLSSKKKEENQLLTQEEPVAKAKGKKKKELETA